MASYSSAVNGLRSHHEAVKPSTWRGYVYRFDAQEYSSSSTYLVGDEVVYDGIHYKCVTAVSAAEEFDSSKWTRVTTGVEYKYQLIFVEDSSFEGGDSSGVGKDTYTAYRIQVMVNVSDGKSYSDPVCMKTRTGAPQPGDYDQFYDAVPTASSFPIDAKLFAGLLADSWEFGTKESFDELAAGGNRW